MSAKPATIDAYAAALPPGVDAVFAAIRRLIASLAPDAEEAIKYDMPAWRLNDTTIIHVAAWKNHIGLYPVLRGDDAFEAAIAPYRDKKDTVKFLYKNPIPFDIIEQIVRTRLADLETRP